MKGFTRLLVVSLLVGGAIPDVLAEAAQRADLAFATLEDLLKLEITSAGRKEQPLDKVAAAIFVVTQEDIRRSGVTALAELLRRVPGIQIARENSGSWAVTVRGFNGAFANKLLVLVDGRSIYNRLGPGVFWGAEDLLLDDIDRIEVIRGPGGAIWGANAVNGVINIVTKSAADTTGTLVRVGDGTFDGQQAAVRYGRVVGDTAFRMSSQWSNHESSRLASDASAQDHWSMFSTSGRVERHNGANLFLATGQVTKSDTRPLGTQLTTPTDFQQTVQPVWNWLRGSMLARWTHAYAGGASFQLQSFYNYNENTQLPEMLQQRNAEHIADIDAELHVGSGRHDLVMGGGYRYLVDNTTPAFGFTITPQHDVAQVVNVFAQDEIALGTRVRVTVGAKLEHESSAGWGLQPTARIMGNLARSQHVWAGVSRALRTPSPADRGLDIKFAAVPGPNGVPLVFGVLGNRAYESQPFRDVEAGYRVTLGPQVSVDVTAFRGHYDKLPTIEPAAPRFVMTPSPYVYVPLQLGNFMEADTKGAELVVRWIPTNTLSIDGSYSHFQLAARVDPSSQDVTSAPAAEDVPANQWQIHSALAMGSRAELSAALFHVSELHLAGVPAYTRADVRLQVTLSKQLSIIASGQNLLHETHAESVSSGTGVVSTRVPRSGGLQLVWRFQ